MGAFTGLSTGGAAHGYTRHMAYAVMVTRRSENSRHGDHRFKLTDEAGQPRSFPDETAAETARARHLATFPADSAEVMRLETARES